MTIEERNELVLNYMPLANKIARKFLNKKSNLDELRSAAYFGLIDAANKFNPDKKCSFSTYVKFRINGEIKDYLRESKKHNFVELEENFIYEENNYNIMDLFSYVFSFLDNKGQSIIKMYYVENKSMKQIGQSLNLTESRVSQLISKYKEKIRNKI